MGQMRFIVSPPQRITEEVLQFAYMSGMDRTPWVVHAEAEEGELVLERDVSDSGSVTVPWQVEGHGLLALSTGHAGRTLGTLPSAGGTCPRHDQCASHANSTSGSRSGWPFRPRCTAC